MKLITFSKIQLPIVIILDISSSTENLMGINIIHRILTLLHFCQFSKYFVRKQL